MWFKLFLESFERDIVQCFPLMKDDSFLERLG